MKNSTATVKLKVLKLQQLLIHAFHPSKDANNIAFLLMSAANAKMVLESATTNA
jgi:hypothetical protein